jgi:hypothetical protein
MGESCAAFRSSLPHNNDFETPADRPLEFDNASTYVGTSLPAGSSSIEKPG